MVWLSVAERHVGAVASHLAAVVIFNNVPFVIGDARHVVLLLDDGRGRQGLRPVEGMALDVNPFPRFKVSVVFMFGSSLCVCVLGIKRASSR